MKIVDEIEKQKQNKKTKETTTTTTTTTKSNKDRKEQGGKKAIVKGWELNDFVVDLS